MKQPLIELIVQAVTDAARPVMLIETASDTLIGIFESELRTALASIPEMPQVDEVVPVGYAKLIRRKNSMRNLTVGKTYPIQSTWGDLIKIIDDAGNIKSYTSGRNWIINLTSPTTKTE